MLNAQTIAFVSDAIYPYNKGGKETRLYELTTRLASRGYDVHIYCMKWWQGPADRVEHGVNLHGICPYIPLYDGERRSIRQGIIFGLACFRTLFAKFDLVDVDHMPFFPLYSMRVVCWLKRKPMVATWHEVWGFKYWQEYLGGWKGWVAAIIERVSVWWPDKIVAVSELTAERLRKSLNYQGKLTIIHNGIDIDQIQLSKPSKYKSDVIFSGRMLAHKNVDLLIEAISLLCKTVSNLQVIIAGDGPELNKLKEMTKKLKLERVITFLPFQDDIKSLYGLMKSSKVFVLPSSREGFGLVVLEANACGLPVVTVDHPDNAAQELVKNGRGLVCHLSSESLAKAISSLLISGKKEKTEIIASSWDEALNQMIRFLEKKKT